ncbi:myb-like domain, Myb/SANT-like DNA-binding domain protein [Artemisia annua]|uniref:Myb-like domain, Myb/SANT-like DNA-binding domain protein n=1 Tax=Artemisia annua TaxID=35608 RepID=A0A2U1M8T4_ARTAN|nr:myb-like domain, Myb/SANT-like DNA-binding domain protein [Artemisia annua]
MWDCGPSIPPYSALPHKKSISPPPTHPGTTTPGCNARIKGTCGGCGAACRDETRPPNFRGIRHNKTSPHPPKYLAPSPSPSGLPPDPTQGDDCSSGINVVKENTKTKADKKAWTSAEEVALAKAWIHISTCKKVGMEQGRDKFWERILEHFSEAMGGTPRTRHGLNTKWKTMNAAMGDFNGLYIQQCSIFVQITFAEDNCHNAETGVKKLENQPICAVWTKMYGASPFQEQKRVLLSAVQGNVLFKAASKSIDRVLQPQQRSLLTEAEGLQTGCEALHQVEDVCSRKEWKSNDQESRRLVYCKPANSNAKEVFKRLERTKRRWKVVMIG